MMFTPYSAAEPMMRGSAHTFTRLNLSPANGMTASVHSVPRIRGTIASTVSRTRRIMRAAIPATSTKAYASPSRNVLSMSRIDSYATTGCPVTFGSTVRNSSTKRAWLARSQRSSRE